MRVYIYIYIYIHIYIYIYILQIIIGEEFFKNIECKLFQTENLTEDRINKHVKLEVK